MANNDPPERDMKEFEFLQLCKFRVAPPGNEAFIQRGKLITCSSNYGLLFYITQEGFNVVKTSELMTIDEGLGKQRSKVTIEDVPVIAKVQLGSCQVASMDVNGDGLYLAVAVNDGNKLSVLFYDIRVFADQSLAPTPFTVSPLNISPNGYLVDLSWNPGVFTMLAVCTSDGAVELVDVTDKAKVVASLKADVGASCFCWSPKGKQLLVGKKDGSLSQYDHALVEKKRWHCPNVLNGPHGVLDVVWQSTHVFVAAYLSAGSQPTDQPVVILSSANKDNVIHVNFEDVCFGSGEVRRPQYFFHQVLKWEMILVASSNATEATVIGKNLDDKTSWEHWNLEDSARAQLPLTKEQNDTFPLGLTVDYSPYKPIVLSESKQLPACPVMYLLSTDGILVGFHLYYNHRDAAPTTIPAQVLTSTGVRKGAPGSVPASQPRQGLLQTPFSPQSTGGAPLSGGGPSFATPTTQPPPVAASTPKLFGTPPAAATPILPFSGFGTKLGPAAATQSFTTVTPLFGTPTTTRFTATTKADTATTAFSTFGSKASGSQPTPLALTTATTTAAPSVSSSTQPFNLFNVSQVTPKAGGQGSTTQPTSLFGIPQSQPTSVFGTPQGQQTSVFGTPQGQQTSVFGTPQGQQTSVFGTPQGQQTSVLGTPQAQPHAPSAFTAKTTSQSQANQGLTPPGNGLLTVPTSGSTPITSSYTGPSPSGSAQATQQPATSNIEATVDSAFTQNIIEEITDFEKELKELRTRSKKAFMKVGTQEEKQLLRRETELMIQFCSEIKDATKDQQREAQEQKSLCFNLFAMAEECKASLQRESDPFYNSLLQKRVLDPASAQKLRSVQQMAQTLEHSIVEVDRVLDAVWQEHLDKKRKEEKLHTPTGDTIFKTIKNNNLVIGSQREQLRKLDTQLKDLKLYSTASNRDIDIVSSGVLNGDTPSPLKIPQNLGVTLASTVTNSMTPEKIARLRDILSQRKVPRVKSSTPANLSMSRIVAQTPGRSPGSTNSPLEQQKLPQRKHPLDSQQTPTGPPPSQLPVPTGLLKLANGQTPKNPASSQQGLSQSRIPQPAPVAQPGKNSTPTAFSGVAYLKPSLQTAAVTKPTAISSPAQVASSSPFAVPGMPKQSQVLVGQTPVSSAVPTDTKPLPPPLTKQSQYYEDVTETDETNDEEDDYDEEDNGYEDEDDDEDESAFPGINEDGVLLPLPVRNDAMPHSVKTLSQAQPQSPTLVPSGNSAFGTRGSSSGTFAFGTGTTTTTPAASGTGGIFKVPQTSVPSSGAQAFTPVKSKTGQQVSSKDLFGAKTTAPAATTGGLSFGGPALFGNKSVPTAPSAGLSTVFGSNATPSRNVGFSDLSTKASSQGGISASSEDSANLDKDLTSSQTSTGNVATSAPPYKSPGHDSHKSPAQAAADAFSFTGASAGTSSFGGNKASPNTSVFGGTPSTTTTSIFGGTPSITTSSIFGGTPSTTTTSVFGGTPPTTTSSIFGGIPTTTSTGGSRFNFATTPGTTTSSTPASSTPASSTTPTSNIFGLKGSADGGRFSFGTKTSPSAPDSLSTSASTVATVKRSSADHPGNEPDSTSGTVAPVSTSENISVTSTAATTPLRSTDATPPPSISTPSDPSFGAPTMTTSLFGVSSTPSSTPFVSTASVFGNNGAASSPFGAASTSTPSLFGGAATTSSSSLFGSNATTSTSSTVFGGNTATSGQSLFGGAAATSAPSVFGGSATTSTPSLFGGANTTPSSSVFGGSAATPSSSVFGGSAATPSSSVFGGNAASSTPSVFGGSSTSTVFGQSASKPLFGSTQASDSAPGFGTSNNSGSAFGGQSFVFGQQSGSAASSTSLFGQQSNSSGSTSLFGQAPAFGQQPSSSSSGPSFGFGGLGGKPSEEKAKQNVFGTPQVFGSPSTQSSNLFGSGGSNTFGSLGSTFSGTGNTGSGFSAGTGVSATGFGVSTQQGSGALGGSSVFGTAPSFGSSSGFGAKPAFSSLPAFGAAPAFGSAPAFSNLGGTSSTFGSTSSGGGFSSFASTQSPTFGQLAQTTPASPGFGSGTAVGGGFGSSQPNPSSPFGGGFGSGQSSFGGGTSLFGQAASSPGFGQAPSNTGFGGAQPTPGFGNSPSFGSSAAFSSYRG